MAKGQQRSNREIRKPKKDKKPPVAPAPFGSAVRLATDGTATGTRAKKK
ncbi:hypothetical protein [Nitratireductor alexandrii]|nr:hypothetical protein [Nitratireductor alexandrii]